MQVVTTIGLDIAKSVYFECYRHELYAAELTDLRGENSRPSSSLAREDRLQSQALLFIGAFVAG